jgi:hypothetical protein
MRRAKVALILLVLGLLVSYCLAGINSRSGSDGRVLLQYNDTATSTTVGVTSAGQSVLVLNENRNCAVLVNDSDTNIYIKLGASPALDTGILLNAYGGSFTITAANCYTGPITAVCNSATAKNLLVTEY